MKIFGGKKNDDKMADGNDEAGYYDSPQETVSLVETRPAQAQPAVQLVQQEEPRAHYGIEEAIHLMRALPVDQNVELVVQVIKTTLESMKVRVSDIIGDAGRKQKDLEDRVSNLTRQISEFEKEISQRKEEISRLEADHLETTSVKERLEMAERAQQSQKDARLASGGVPRAAEAKQGRAT